MIRRSWPHLVVHQHDFTNRPGDRESYLHPWKKETTGVLRWNHFGGASVSSKSRRRHRRLSSFHWEKRRGKLSREKSVRWTNRGASREHWTVLVDFYAKLLRNSRKKRASRIDALKKKVTIQRPWLYIYTCIYRERKREREREREKEKRDKVLIKWRRWTNERVINTSIANQLLKYGAYI